MGTEDQKSPAGASSPEQQRLLVTHEEAAKALNGTRDTSKLEGHWMKALAFAVFSVTFGSSFQFGYHIGCVNAPGKLITAWYKQSHYHLHNQELTDSQANLAWAISVGIFAVGGMVGGLMSGWLADKMGRKGALLFNNLFAIIAAVMMIMANVNVYYLMTAGRLIIGFNAGLNSGLVPIYLTEVSPINMRGMLGSMMQLLVTIAILFSQILGLPFIWGTAERWPLIFAFTVVPCIVQLVTLPLCPESPKYNLITKAKSAQAEKDLKKLRGREDVSDEMEAINEEAAAARSQAEVTWANMFSAALRWPLFIAVMMMLSQQLSGINVAMFYSTKIFEDAGLTGNMPFYATIAMGTINVAQTLVSVWLVDHPKFGRRSLHLAGLVGMLFSTILIVVAMAIQNGGSNDAKTFASYASIICVLLFVVAFATGPGSIPWFFVSEIFPSNARGKASSIAVLANWLANFVVGTSFLPLNDILGEYTFLVFATFLAFFIAFTYKFVPETKGKTVEQINAEWKH